MTADNSGHPTSSEESVPPFRVEYADRVQRLPPYLFGRSTTRCIRNVARGHDVIDLGMGNPSDPPEKLIIEKAV